MTSVIALGLFYFVLFFLVTGSQLMRVQRWLGSMGNYPDYPTLCLDVTRLGLPWTRNVHILFSSSGPLLFHSNYSLTVCSEWEK